MNLIEMLLTSVGPAIAKTALKRWLEDDEYARDAGVAIVDMLKKKIPNLLTRNKAEREFDRVAEQVATQLVPFLEVEVGGLLENEQEATVLAIAATFDEACITDKILFESDLDPNVLVRLLRESSPDATKDLSDAATALYQKMLGECATYVVEITSMLPAFAHKSASEILKREGQITELVQKVLAELPKLRADSEGETADRTFENDYRRGIVRKLDRLELFGITTNVTSRRYSLSVAYITLSATKAAECIGRKPVGEKDENDIDYLRIDDALKDSHRLLIRGEAGSGKTTLLQWLAVRSARQDFSDALQDWNGQLPFFLQLRRWWEDDLPKPEEYLDRIIPNLTGAMPEGWVTRQLKAGALLLIDGIDEVPNNAREKIRHWVDDLAKDFPACRIVVTSRSAAVAEGWLSAEGFEEAELQPMERADIEALIDQWYEAAHHEEGDGERRDQLDNYRDSLKATIRTNRSLRHLATTPLLCAMICTLHLDRRKNVPNERMKLYQVALDMMLDRREAERASVFPEFEKLQQREKESLLQNFAYWLMVTDRSDAGRSEAESRLAHAQLALSEIDYKPAKLLQFLLERSGLLREPVKGRIDFIHRTFQEYLAAKQAIDENHVNLLIKHAHLAEWRETIILAAGHGSQRNCDELVSGLLDRADHERKLRHQFILLAIGCLATATRLSPSKRRRAQESLACIMPPKKVDEGRAIAEAGDLAIPYLKVAPDSKSGTIIACITALGLIGGDAAIEILRTYVNDKRKSVISALFIQLNELNALHLMDSVTLLSLPERAFRSLPSMSNLQNLTTLNLNGCRSLMDLSGLQGLSNLQSLDLGFCSSLTNLNGLQCLRKLQRIILQDCKKLTDVSALQGTSDLRFLDLGGCHALWNLTPLHQLNNLEIKGLSHVQRAEFPRGHVARHENPAFR